MMPTCSPFPARLSHVLVTYITFTNVSVCSLHTMGCTNGDTAWLLINCTPTNQPTNQPINQPTNQPTNLRKFLTKLSTLSVKKHMHCIQKGGSLRETTLKSKLISFSNPSSFSGSRFWILENMFLGKSSNKSSKSSISSNRKNISLTATILLPMYTSPL